VKVLNRPAAQGCLGPPAQKWPSGHTEVVAMMDPGGHSYPGAHWPLQFAVVRPGVDPKVPEGQGAW
jgi:hypothetical protein